MRLAPFLALLATPAVAEVAVTDRTGATVTLPAPAERVFCLSEPCLHALAVLGLAPVGAWPSYYRNVLGHPRLFGEAAHAIPVLPGTEAPDLEALAALDPDLIVGWEGSEDVLPPEVIADIAPLYQADYDLLMPDLETLGHDLTMLARATGREGAGDALLGRLADRQAAYLARLGDAPRREVMVVRLEAPDTRSIWALPCGPLVMQVAACPPNSGDWAQYTPEALLAADPDVLVVEDWGANEGTFAPEAWTAAGVPLWDEVPAVAEGRVHYVPVLATGPYSPLAWGETLDALMPLLYPETFPAPLTDAEVAAALAE